MEMDQEILMLEMARTNLNPTNTVPAEQLTRWTNERIPYFS